MTMRLSLYGYEKPIGSYATVGKSKASERLAARMPSRELLAKVGTVGVGGKITELTHRVVRLKAAHR